MLTMPSKDKLLIQLHHRLAWLWLPLLDERWLLLREDEEVADDDLLPPAWLC